MKMQQKLEKFDDIFKIYPNYFNWELPLRARCARMENKENATLAFLKYCPKIFVISDVQPTKLTRTWLVWRVEYRLKDGENFPESDDPLMTMDKLLTTYTPDDTLVIQRELTPPSSAIIMCAVVCKCALCYLEVPVESPQLWPTDKYETDIMLLENLNLD